MNRPQNHCPVPFLNQIRATPNLLTLLRLFIVPFIVIEVLDSDFNMAFALFLLAGITDALDGLLARWLSQKTTLGQYLDPIADKLLLSTLFLVLTHVALIPRYVTVLVFSRDLGILLISTLLFATGTLRDFRPSWLGKLNTLVQILGVVTVMSESLFLRRLGSCYLAGLDLVGAAAGSRHPGAGLGGPICVDRSTQNQRARNGLS
jgi:cardiolipin synthase